MILNVKGKSCKVSPDITVDFPPAPHIYLLLGKIMSNILDKLTLQTHKRGS